MAATYMLRKHLAQREAAKRPEAVAERAAEIAAFDRAAAELKSKFPNITPENFKAADRYHKDRIRHWRAAAQSN